MVQETAKRRWLWVGMHFVVATILGAIYDDKSSVATYFGIVALLKSYGV